MLTERLEQATLIVCHPDDEVLWFSSLLEKVRKIIIVYSIAPDMETWTEGRHAAEDEYPLANAEFWHYTESMCFQGGDWSAPTLNDMGLVLNQQGPLPAYNPQLYEQNYHRLLTELEPVVRDSAAVITHNPWGEYGHEDHVMMYHAVSQLANRFGTPLWYDNHVSDRSLRLMSRFLGGKQKSFEFFPTNPKLAGCIQSLYEKHNCWTWPFPDYVYPDNECMILDSGSDQDKEVRGATAPLNYVDVDGGYPPSDPTGAQRDRRWMRLMTKWTKKWR